MSHLLDSFNNINVKTGDSNEESTEIDSEKMTKPTQDEIPKEYVEKVDSENSQTIKTDDADDIQLNTPTIKTLIGENVNPSSRVSIEPGSGKKAFSNSVLARKNWAKAVRAVNMTSALKKVTVENKVGTKASDLDDDDELKVIALSLQRALRDFGKIRSSGLKNKSKTDLNGSLEGTKTGDHTISYEKHQDKSKYESYQPKFSCTEMHSENFSQIRKVFNLKDQSYFASVGLQEKRKESDYYVINSKDAAGKSLSFFLLSPDQRIIFKLCTSADVKSINNICTQYKDHVKSCAGDGQNKTLLPCIYGIYKLEFSDPNIPSVVLMAQKNFFASGYKIHKKYDLKGSTYKRLASEKEKAKNSPCFKDLDWIYFNEKLRFKTKGEMNDVLEQLKKDSLFLSQNNLIDYSILVGIHNKDLENPDHYNRKHDPFESSMAVSDKDNSYKYYGIVDILTPYTKKKVAETFFMGTLFCGRDISCQPPAAYQKRFVKFSSEHVLANDEG